MTAKGDGKDGRDEMVQAVARQVKRKQRSRREGHRGLWFGFGMFGLIGWAVAAPTLLGIALGLWLDSRWPVRFSWTIALLFAGVTLGCINAWWWVRRESPRD